jgi:rfaE bifunctional protein kinase chain/domain/rfaE bifunctional protein nucleotidyltransferase chain/domain
MTNFKEILGFDEKINNKILKSDSSILIDSRIDKVLVMCHGTFDLVHPGHIRHFSYAKSKGDLLLVSLTSDAFVLKANARPYVPQDLRALNLAALEMVDFVIIDDSDTPIELIDKIKPDVFVKGFEYNKNNILNPKSIEEKAIIDSYGGTFLFSPGDFVLSSSKIIEQNPPKIAIEKLLILMQIENISFEEIFKVLNEMQYKKICIIGDTIVDGLVEASVIGGYRKSPTPSVKVTSEKWYVGGAAIVAKHLAATGAVVHFSSVTGDDQEGKFVSNDLANSTVKADFLIDADRPTTFKNTIMADGYKMIRVDKVENKSIDENQLQYLAKTMTHEKFDAVIFSDFRHGIFNKNTISNFMKMIPRDTMTVADSQVASRWGNVLDFKGVDLITPNEQEVRFAMGDQDTVIRPLVSELYEKSECKVLFLKLGSRGTMTFRSSKVEPQKRSFFSIDSLHLQPIIDPVGAGDAFLAYSVLAYTVSTNEVISSIIGNIAAGLACETEGNEVIELKKIIERIEEIQSMYTSNE